MKRHRQRGSILAGLLILLLFAMAIAALVLSVGQVGSLTGVAMKERAWEGAAAAWRRAVAYDALVELRAHSFTTRYNSDLERRSARVAAILQPSAAGTLAGIRSSPLSLGALSADPWSKLSLPVAVPTAAALHPLGPAPYLTVTQSVSATLNPDSVTGARAIVGTLTFGVWAASDVGLILLDSYDGSSGPSLVIAGATVCASGFSTSAGTTRLSAARICSPSGILASGAAGSTIYGTRVAVHPHYAVGWGAHPSTLCLPYNQSGSLAAQSFFDRATAVVNIMNGTPLGVLPAGVSYGEYPAGSGVMRVKLDLATLGPAGANIYVSLHTPADRSDGIAVIGAASASAGQLATVATNGAVLLAGNNVMPVTVASSFGQVSFNDLTGLPALAQSWVGALFFPVATAYSTTQSAGGAAFTLQGSLVTGTPSGTLPRINVTETHDATIRFCGPRFASLLNVR